MAKLLNNWWYSGECSEGGMPAIVDEDLFARVRERLARNKRSGSRKEASDDEYRYWLTGKLYCGECGGTMQGV